MSGRITLFLLIALLSSCSSDPGAGSTSTAGSETTVSSTTTTVAFSTAATTAPPATTAPSTTTPSTTTTTPAPAQPPGHVHVLALPAVEAGYAFKLFLASPAGAAIGPDGALYIADVGHIVRMSDDGEPRC